MAAVFEGDEKMDCFVSGTGEVLKRPPGATPAAAVVAGADRVAVEFSADPSPDVAAESSLDPPLAFTRLPVPSVEARPRFREASTEAARDGDFGTGCNLNGF